MATRLTQSMTSGGSTTKFTKSIWVKRTGLTQGYVIDSQDDEVAIQFRDDHKLNVFIYSPSSYSTNLVSNQLFRDTNAWYHIVYAVDYTNATQAHRARVYVNGEEITSWSTETRPGNNTTTFNTFNSSITHYIGNNAAANKPFDGLMSHVIHVDGTQYAPTEFGETDSTTGEWKFKAPSSVTWGTKGYWILKDGNSVTDASPNTNNWTVGGGTLTKTEDCPSNVFSTLDNLNQEAGANGTTFSNGNTTYSSGGHSNVRFYVSNLGANKGKFYCEVKPTSLSAHNLIGVATHGITSAMGNYYFGGSGNEAHTGDEYEWGYKAETGNIENNATSTSYGNTYAANDIIGIAMDLDNNKLYFSKNGTWQNSGVPTSGSTGTGAVSITDPDSTDTGFYHFAVAKATSSTNTATFQCNFGNGYFGTTAVSSAGTNASGVGIFEYDVPTGYTALSTKGLNL